MPQYTNYSIIEPEIWIDHKMIKISASFSHLIEIKHIVLSGIIGNIIIDNCEFISGNWNYHAAKDEWIFRPHGSVCNFVANTSHLSERKLN